METIYTEENGFFKLHIQNQYYIDEVEDEDYLNTGKCLKCNALQTTKSKGKTLCD